MNSRQRKKRLKTFVRANFKTTPYNDSDYYLKYFRPNVYMVISHNYYKVDGVTVTTTSLEAALTLTTEEIVFDYADHMSAPLEIRGFFNQLGKYFDRYAYKFPKSFIIELKRGE